jgi:hypothetical protein
VRSGFQPAAAPEQHDDGRYLAAEAEDGERWPAPDMAHQGAGSFITTLSWLDTTEE